MKQILKKILNTLFSRKGALVLSAVAVMLCVPELVQAASPTSSSSGDNSETVQNFAQTLGIVVTFLNAILWPLLLAIGDLMDVDMIIGPGMESRLLDIWVQIRNLVNIAFVLVLLVVAFYNVLGIGGGEGELAIKTALPKIIIGLVLVNFTYVGGRVVLDLANVGTTIAFGLPKIIQDEQTGDTGYSFDPELAEFERSICFKPASTETTSETTSSETTSSETTSTASVPLQPYTEEEAPIQTKLFCEYNKGTSSIEEELLDTSEDGEAIKVTIPADSYGGLRETMKLTYFRDLNKNNVALIMAVNMGSLGKQNLLKADEINTFKDLTVNLIFSTVMYLVFAVSYVVLAIVLLVRVVVLWLALAFSPIAVLVYVVPQIKEWLGGGGDFSQKVIKHLIAPIIIGFTLSMGFLLMSAWNQVGASTSAYKSSEVDEVISNELLITGIDDLPKLILAIASVVVVWMGVFSAAEGTYAEGLTKQIQDVGGKVKDFAFKAPFLAPILPINAKGEDKETSIMAFGSVLKSGLDNFQDAKLQGQVSTLLDGSPELARFAGDRARDDKNVESNRVKVERLVGDAGGSFTKDEAQELARSLMYIVEGNEDLDDEKKKEYLTKLKEFQDNPRSYQELREIIRGADHEDFKLTELAYKTLTTKGENGTQDEFEKEDDEDDKGKKDKSKSKLANPDEGDDEGAEGTTPKTSTGAVQSGAKAGAASKEAGPDQPAQTADEAPSTEATPADGEKEDKNKTE